MARERTSTRKQAATRARHLTTLFRLMADRLENPHFADLHDGWVAQIDRSFAAFSGGSEETATRAMIFALVRVAREHQRLADDPVYGFVDEQERDVWRDGVAFVLHELTGAGYGELAAAIDKGKLRAWIEGTKPGPKGSSAKTTDDLARAALCSAGMGLDSTAAASKKQRQRLRRNLADKRRR